MFYIFNNFIAVEATGLIIIRILMGSLQGPIMPAFIQILSAWVPVAERGFLGGFAFSGMTVGTWQGFTYIGESVRLDRATK